jgi:hypothetical protein
MLRKIPSSFWRFFDSMPILRRQVRRDSRQSTPTALARTARRGSLDDSRILTFIDLSGNVVGVVTQPEVDTRSTAPRVRAPLGILTLPRIEP